MANTRDGLAAARARGHNGGRHPKLTADLADIKGALATITSTLSEILTAIRPADKRFLRRSEPGRRQ